MVKDLKFTCHVCWLTGRILQLHQKHKCTGYCFFTAIGQYRLIQANLIIVMYFLVYLKLCQDSSFKKLILFWSYTKKHGKKKLYLACHLVIFLLNINYLIYLTNWTSLLSHSFSFTHFWCSTNFQNSQHFSNFHVLRVKLQWIWKKKFCAKPSYALFNCKCVIKKTLHILHLKIWNGLPSNMTETYFGDCFTSQQAGINGPVA